MVYFCKAPREKNKKGNRIKILKEGTGLRNMLIGL